MIHGMIPGTTRGTIGLPHAGECISVSVITGIIPLGTPGAGMAGAVILANGFKLLNPADLEEFDYSEKDDVYTTLEIEEQLT